jgi:hypothetical protein
MYGAALFSARTATDGSGRFMIMEEYSETANDRITTSGQHAMQDSHLHRQTIEGLALDH